MSAGREGFWMSFGLGQYCGSTELPRPHMMLEESTVGTWMGQKSKKGEEIQDYGYALILSCPWAFCIASLCAGRPAWPCVKSWSLTRSNYTKHFPLGKFLAGTGLPLPFHWAKRLSGAEVRRRRPLCKQPGNVFGKWWWHSVWKMGLPVQAAQRHPTPELDYIHPLPPPLPLLLC